MQPADSRFGVARRILRLAVVAAFAISRRVAATARSRADAIGQMNDRQLQDVGLTRRRLPAPADVFANVQAQLGVFR